MKKSLILIDFINDICHQDGAFGCYLMLNENDAFNKVNRVLEYARTNNWLVIWIIVGFNPNYLEANPKSPLFTKAKENKKLQQVTWGTEIVPYLNYKNGELIICKNAVNPFHATNLDHVLRANHVEELYLTGVATEMAIQSATRDAHDRGYLVNIVADCCGSSNLAWHNASLEMLGRLATVIDSKELVA